MHSNLFWRTISAVVLVPMVLGPICFGDYIYNKYNIPVYRILLAIFGTLMAWEWGEMFKKQGSSNQLVIALTAGITAMMAGENPAFCLWVILLGMLIVIRLSQNLKFALGVPYICLPILSLGYIYYVGYLDKDSLDHMATNPEIILWLLFVVWATDVGGYVVGRTVGGPKLAPKISAKKTWSGLIGAILFAMGIAYVFALYLKAEEQIPNMKAVLVISAGVLAVVSQIGDFFESAIKRKLGLKDSSNLIPGHGGVFDRVDGLLFASMATAFVLFLMNGWM